MDDALSRATELDDGDALAGWRDLFVLPDPDLVYLNGNSLGRLPLATIARLQSVATEEWGTGLSRSFVDAGWVGLPARVGDLLATDVLGAGAGEIVATDSTTVGLYKLAWAALEARPDRNVIVADSEDFPTDRYVLEGLAAARGAQIRWLSADPVTGPSVVDVESALEADVALVSLSHVGYRSGALLDAAAITEVSHDSGALVLLDLCHSAGVVPVGLESLGVDLAVGCTYKYLSGGPGAPSFLYVRKALQDSLSQPIWGWWSRENMMAMGPGYQRAPGISAYLGGTPGILALAAAEEGVRIIAEARVSALRAKSILLTSFAVELFDEMLSPLGFELGSPRDSARRGGHVALRHAAGRQLVNDLEGVGVVADFREPDSIRFGLAPLTTRFVDVYEGCTRLADLAAAR